MALRFSPITVVAGAVVALAAQRLARPLLVTTVSAGMEVGKAAAQTLGAAKTELGKVLAEASEIRQARSDMSALQSEVKKLREELAALKGMDF